MKNFLLLTLALMAMQLRAQSFYDLSTIQTIEITFAQSNWDALLDNAYATTGDYILAQSVTINGVTMDSVGVKYKGNSTYQANQVKNPWHIELDTYKDHEYDGYTDIKLSNVAKDPSFLREVISYQILRQYMDAPLSNYANVFVNGNLIGLYSNSESISRKFVNARFGSKNNTFVKCNPPAGAGPQATELPTLVYQGEDSTAYYEGYELKSEGGWDELIDLMDTLVNHSDDIADILDVDRTLWMLAFNNVLVNLDSYSGSFAQNYYLYRSDNGRFIPVVWDLNESFGRFSMSGAGGSLNSTAAKQQLDHLLHDGNSARPLIRQLLANPTYKRMYLAHVKTMVEENFANGAYEETGLELQTVIDAAVQADPNKFFTYNNFVSNLASDVSSGGGGGPGGGGATPGIVNLMDGRASYLLGLSDFTQPEPTIDNVFESDDAPEIGQTITITADITTANTVYLGYRNNLYDVFTRLELFDDGAHGDGAAGDGTYGNSLMLNDATTQYYVYAENDDIGKFSPVRAEYEYYVISASSTNGIAGDLVINEFLASNDEVEADQDGEFDDWIELYNNGDTEIDLSGYFLSDNEENPEKWDFPEETVIAPGGYLIIWADEDGEQEGLHANFKLSAGGETILLSDTEGTLLDQITYGEQTTDVSFGRFPNGTGDFQTMNPTFNAENEGTNATNSPGWEDLGLAVFPNPVVDLLHVQSASTLRTSDFQLSLISIDGREVRTTTLPRASSGTTLDVANLTPALYFLRVTDGQTVQTTKVMVGLQ